MQWIAPSEKDAANETLEKRLWAAADQSLVEEIKKQLGETLGRYDQA
jgi:hypothetical protein